MGTRGIVDGERKNVGAARWSRPGEGRGGRRRRGSETSPRLAHVEMGLHVFFTNFRMLSVILVQVHAFVRFCGASYFVVGIFLGVFCMIPSANLPMNHAQPPFFAEGLIFFGRDGGGTEGRQKGEAGQGGCPLLVPVNGDEAFPRLHGEREVFT